MIVLELSSRPCPVPHPVSPEPKRQISLCLPYIWGFPHIASWADSGRALRLHLSLAHPYDGCSCTSKGGNGSSNVHVVSCFYDFTPFFVDAALFLFDDEPVPSPAPSS